jgi:hypothetical protein
VAEWAFVDPKKTKQNTMLEHGFSGFAQLEQLFVFR